MAMQDEYNSSRVESLMHAYKACKEAIAKVCETAPNSRDFSCQLTFNIARDDHRNRLDRLNAVARELTAVAQMIQRDNPYPKG